MWVHSKCIPDVWPNLSFRLEHLIKLASNSRARNFMVNTELINSVQAKGSLGTPLTFSVNNFQSFLANSLKFGDFS